MKTISTKYGFSLTANPESFFAQYLEIHGTYEEAESELVLALVRPGDHCIDAGAHVGYFACLMAKAGASVLAVEPNPMHALTLRVNALKQDIVISEMALSDADDTAPVPFYLPSDYDDGWGSLYAADRGDRSKPATAWPIRLDSLLKLTDYHGRIRLLKMDVEGSEVAALRGLGTRLQDVDYILIECIDIPQRSAGSSVERINGLLRGWQVRQHKKGLWEVVDAALNNGENFLFVNPATGIHLPAKK